MVLRIPSRFYVVIVNALLAIVLVAYFLDCFSPLRLHVDTVRYYAIKDCIEFGCPPDSDAASDYFPLGYTSLLLALSKFGILRSFAIILINNIYLFSGLLFAFGVFQSLASRNLFILLVLLQWLMVKFVAHPLSEMQYLFFSMLSLYCFYQFKETRRIKFLIFSFVACWFAFVTRTVGVTLFGALIFGLFLEFQEACIGFIKRQMWLIILGFAAVAFLLYLFSGPLGFEHYLNVLLTHFEQAPLIKRLNWRFMEWGELLLNLPSNKISGKLLGASGSVYFVLTGAIVCFWFFYRLIFIKNTVPLFVRTYMLFYTLLMFFWPFYDPRFWVPIAPLIIGTLLSCDFVKERFARLFWRTVLVFYIPFGLFATGYMVYSSFDKRFFAQSQANGAYRTEYEIHLLGRVPTDTTVYDPYVLDLLKRYD